MSETLITDYLLERLPELIQRTYEHIYLTGVSTGIAAILGISFGVLTLRNSKLSSFLLAVVSILQTIPSLAILVILLVLFQKIGILPALTALILYALLPIFRNTLVGLRSIPKEILDAAVGVGMTHWQEIRLVRIPIAIPVIMAGIRTAAVVGVGIATLSAFIGAGGLGEFINRGLALSNTRLICLGAIPAAILALIVDFVLSTLEKSLQPKQKRDPIFKLQKIAAILILVFISVGIVFNFSNAANQTSSNKDNANGVVRIASKNFTEQHILGELMAQVIEKKTNLRVERKFNLGGTLICHEALKRGEIDLYAEYTGTGLVAILDQEVISDADKSYDLTAKLYREKFNLIWLKPFGFNNTYTLTVRKEDAIKNNWKSITDLSSSTRNLMAGFTPEFQERPDGYRKLQKVYGLQFRKVKDLDPSLTYLAISNNEVDVIDGFSTDGRIPAYQLISLKDDKKFFPPYYAAPVIRGQTIQQFPELKEALSFLANAIDDATMTRLNFEVDEKKHEVKEVVAEYLNFRAGV
jgi:osmoprotectant transport system permease protein